MTGEGSAERTRIARLLREVAPDRQALDRLAAELQAYAPRLADTPDERPLLALVAMDLHDYYTALETLFERVARLLDGDLPTGNRWHRELLEQMATDLSPVRPPVLHEGDLAWLQDLLRFRHFLRNAYAVELDAGRLLTRARALQAGHPGLAGRLDALVRRLQALRDGLG